MLKTLTIGYCRLMWIWDLTLLYNVMLLHKEKY